MTLSAKRLFNTTGPSFSLPFSFSFFVIACTEILMRLCLHHLCGGYLPLTDEQAGCYGCRTKKIKTTQTWRWVRDHPVLGTLFPSQRNLGPSLPLSLRAACHNAFVCHLLEEACSAADFTPSSSALPSLNTSLWLWFIATLLLSPNPLVMLPVLATPKIEDLSPRSRL